MAVSKTISYTVTVDDEDADLLDNLTVINPRNAPQELPNRVTRRFLGIRPSGYHIDHIDDDWTNNRRVNLQYIPAIANLRKHAKNRYIGVSKTYNGKWSVKASFGGRGGSIRRRDEYIGTFSNEFWAAMAYDAYVIANNLDKQLNFPEPHYD